MTTNYRGRFAPSPTGPLHFGSLVAALASWLDARANQGEWLVRIEDIDPPRTIANSDKDILNSLERHGLVWDGEVSYQSQRQHFYAEALEQLRTMAKSYRCSCSRSELAAMGGIYDGRCITNEPSVATPHAIRIKLGNSPDSSARWLDKIQGQAQFTPGDINGDFVVLRRDKLYSYQLAVAIDDWQQEITRVIRGYDLFDSTARQIMLLQALDKPLPEYGHIPVAVAANGQKLSKQNQATKLDNSTASKNLVKALNFLGQTSDESMEELQPSALLNLAIQNWKLDKVPDTQAIRVC